MICFARNAVHLYLNLIKKEMIYLRIIPHHLRTAIGMDTRIHRHHHILNGKSDFMKTAFIVVGPEGSGTYMLTEALASAGCTYVDKMLESIPSIFHEKIVARMSIPHAGKFINPKSLYLPYTRARYRIVFLVIFRDANASRQSVMGRDPERGYSQVWAEYRKAMVQIASILPAATVVSYEAFVDNPGYRKWLFEFYGLDEPKGEWFNANEKYYE
jgi:hypothetical protein